MKHEDCEETKIWRMKGEVKEKEKQKWRAKQERQMQEQYAENLHPPKLMYKKRL